MRNSIQNHFDAHRHIGVTSPEIPKEETTELHDRPDIPAPSPWAYSVVVTHRFTKERAVVHKVDLMTRQLRLWYPSRAAAGVAQKDQFDSRTGWQSFEDWIPEFTFSPSELARQEAASEMARELDMYDAQEMALVSVLCDDADPTKALAKLRMLRTAGLVRAPALADPASVTTHSDPKKTDK